MAKEYLIGDFLHRIKRPISLVDDQDYKLVTIRSKHNGVVLRGIKKGFEIKSNMYEVKAGDFVISGIDARNGAFGIISEELDKAVVTNDFWYFDIDESIIDKHLFLELTATTWFDEICNRGSDGTTHRIRLQKDRFFNQKVWLPEPHEQPELLKLLTTAKKSKIAIEEEIRKQKTLVSQLKQSILQEAIEGKLTADWRKQHPDVEPASELLKRIKAEKAKLIKEKKLKKEKPLPPISADEIPFDLPDGWVWCRLYDTCSYIQRGKSPKYSPIKKYPVLAQKCVQWHGLEMFKAKFIDPDTIVKYAEERILRTGDLLWNSTGRGSLGRIGIYDEIVNEYELAVADSHVTVIRTFKSNLIPHYIFYYLAGPTVQNVIDSQSTGSTNQTELATSTVKQYPIPLPPFNEQQAIVEKVETLLEKCRLLETEITLSEQHAQQLMQAVLKEAFETEN